MNHRTLSMRPNSRKILACVLYALPIIFAIISVFLITTSGEDIFQGASNLTNGNTINTINDATNAFNFNSRITDMYAWPIIDFYDYQFNFGPDTILRLIDVVMISAVFYFSTYLILNRKPKLQLKDALIFCATFVSFIITPFGYAFYREFSMIHNYAPLALVTLVFSIPYLRLIAKRTFTIRHPFIFAVLLFILGIIFGMSATVTPIAFLVTTIIYAIIRHKSLTRPPLWFFTGIIGTIIGFLICWLAGSGVDHYTSTSATATAFDYIPLGDIFANIPKLIFHNVYNFGLVFIPLLALVVICLFFLKSPKKLFSKSHLSQLSPSTFNITLVFAIFIIIHILGATLVKSPPRLLIPAYLAGLILIFRLFVPHLKYNTIFTYTITTITFVVVIIHGVLLTKYHLEMTETLKAIKSSDEPIVCIDPSSTKPTRIPIIDLSQANMIVDWSMPEPIYDKQIIPCK